MRSNLQANKKIILYLFIAAFFAFIGFCPLIFSYEYSSATAISNSLYFGRNKLVSKGTKYVNAYDAICTGIGNKSSSISLSSYNITIDDLHMVYDLYRFDHSEHYWIPNKYTISYIGSKVTGISMTYLTGFDANLFESGVQSYLALTQGKTSDYDKALVLHDALVKNVTYVSGATNAHNAYGAIVENEAVCEGYAEAYQYLLQRCGVQAYSVTGYSHNEGHEWNLVRLDGKYYYTDVTWDDPLSNDEENKPVYHAYFNVSTRILQEDHTITDDYSVLPVCTNEDMLYKEMAVMSAYNVDEAAAAIKIKGNVGTIILFYTGTSTDNFATWINANYSQIKAKTPFAGKSVSTTYKTQGREHIVTMVGPSIPASSVTLDYTRLSLVEGQSMTMGVILFPFDTTDYVVWSTSDASVATVDENGLITALHRGTATITATAGRKTETCTVTVRSNCSHSNQVHYDYKPSTCSEQGWGEHYECPDCGLIYIEDIEYREVPYLPLISHSGGTANCHTKAICTMCGNEYGELNPNNHEGGTELRRQKDATCSKTGYTGDTYCKGCNTRLIAGTTISKLDHDFTITYISNDSDELKHYHVCKNCGTKDSGEEHHFDSKNDCTICGYSKGQELSQDTIFGLPKENAIVVAAIGGIVLISFLCAVIRVAKRKK